MKYEDKFNRAFIKSVIETRDMNAGAFRSCSCVFKFTHEGTTHIFRVKVERSNPAMTQFGYGVKKNEDSIWKSQNSYTFLKIDFPDFIDQTKLADMQAKAIQTESEVAKAYEGYTQSVRQFREDFCLN